MNAMKSEKAINSLLEIAEKARGDIECVELPRGIDVVNSLALLLLLLQSRKDSNIN